MFHYQMCGLPEVWLVNGFRKVETPHGTMVSIEDTKGLHRAIGRELVAKPSSLNADEVRFLRKEMDLSQKALAAFLGVEEVTLRKWESPTGHGIQGPADRLLRVLYLEYTDNQSGIVRSLVERLVQLDIMERTLPLRFRETDHGWQKDAAAA